MKPQITSLKPTKIWKNFNDLTKIPRPSKSEQKAVDFINDFGKKLGFETVKDNIGNTVIRKPATAGMEGKKTVIFQSHLDMVPQKNVDKEHDFKKDPIQAYVDGDWVTADGTTLGADNGIGVAVIMSVLESVDIEHGPVEALFTIDEETGLTGASSLKPEMLKGDILLNLDSEDEGELYIGCAGGINAHVTFSYGAEKIPDNHIPYQVSVGGFKGGHSGLDIHLGRGNAIIILIRLLWRATFKCNVRLSDVNGGSLRNAIPREAFATIVVPKEKEDEFLKFIKGYESMLKEEYRTIEPDFSIKAEKTGMPEGIIDDETTKKIISAIYTCPNGVIRMSRDMEDLVETSSNLAVVKTDFKKVKVECLLRSSLDSAKEDLANRIQSLFELASAEVMFEGEYPGWKPDLDSEILDVAKNVYNNKFGSIPHIKAVHAGLECGIIGGIYPNLDMISMGPTIRGAHSPDEKVLIESVSKFWEYLIEILKNIPDK
ncbi:MAG: aminoacyl-histidine dipeptidase [Bacteroidales bacterium]|nr:MAG: aminoacyl-histidine dipeptidase [Bacteroidales bacterium]